MVAHAAKSDITAKGTLGIIAGGGRLPQELAEFCQSTNRPFFVVALEGYAQAERFSGMPHKIVRLGAVGESLDHFRKAGAKELVLAGHVKRPSLTSVRPDSTGARLLARVSKKIFAGDDAILRSVTQFLEEEGFAVIGVDSVMTDLLSPAGVLGKIQPDERSQQDIATGIKVALALGELDVGQAVIVERGYVLGVEAAEGTAELIRRCALLKKEAKGGVLVKWCKPQQDRRMDLPSIGPETIDDLAKYGFSGVALHRGGSIILDQERTIEKADAQGLFITGIEQ